MVYCTASAPILLYHCKSVTFRYINWHFIWVLNIFRVVSPSVIVNSLDLYSPHISYFCNSIATTFRAIIALKIALVAALLVHRIYQETINVSQHSWAAHWINYNNKSTVVYCSIYNRIVLSHSAISTIAYHCNIL